MVELKTLQENMLHLSPKRGYLPGWLIEGEGWWKEKAGTIHCELTPKTSFSSKEAALFWGCAAWLCSIFFFFFPHLKIG